MLSETLKLSINTLRANKGRAFLTILGIAIGIGAVITLLAVGTGVQKYIGDLFSSVGTNLIGVQPGRMQRGPGGNGFGNQATLTVGDYNAIVENATGLIAEGAAFTQIGNFTYEGNNSEVTVYGITPNYLTARSWGIEAGRGIEESDAQAKGRVVILGQTVVNDLFPDDDPLNKTIKLNNLPFRVIGIAEGKGSSLFGDQDAIAFIPLETAHDRVFTMQARANSTEPRISGIALLAADEKSRDRIKQEATDILRARHRIADDESADFTIATSAELINAFGAVTSVLTIFLGAIGGISLLVGGVGIMNIMLVSVTERTREIGLRKAIGARQRSILSQFLSEAMLLSVIGGILGILIGVGLSELIKQIADFKPIVQPSAIVLAVGFSIAVGLFFGIYPARRASQLNPVEALRYE